MSGAASVSEIAIITAKPPRPWCARCKRLVDRMSVDKDTWGSTLFTVECHGEVEWMRILDAFLDQAAWSFGVAFASDSPPLADGAAA